MTQKKVPAKKIAKKVGDVRHNPKKVPPKAPKRLMETVVCVYTMSEHGASLYHFDLQLPYGWTSLELQREFIQMLIDSCYLSENPDEREINEFLGGVELTWVRAAAPMPGALSSYGFLTSFDERVITELACDDEFEEYKRLHEKFKGRIKD